MAVTGMTLIWVGTTSHRSFTCHLIPKYRVKSTERYATQLTNYYQLIADQDAACTQQEVEWLRQTIQQHSTLQNQSQLSAPTQSSTPTATAMLAGQLGSQTAASAALPALALSDTTVPAVDLPEHHYSIYYPTSDPATVIQ